MTTMTDMMIAENYSIEDTQEWETVACEVKYH